MNEVRSRLRQMLTRPELDLDDWLHNLANVEGDTEEDVILNSMGFGLFFRCMAIAALHPDWTFFAVLGEAKRTAQSKLQVKDMILKRRRM